MWRDRVSRLRPDAFGRSILCGPLDPTLANATNKTASYAHGNYESVVLNVTKRFSNHFQVFANYIWSQNKDNGASERDTDTYFGQQDPINLKIDYVRNGLDIRHQFKAAGVYELPWGFEVSSSVIAHTGVPFPFTSPRTSTEIGDNFRLLAQQRPSDLHQCNGKTSLLDSLSVRPTGIFRMGWAATKGHSRLRELHRDSVG